MSAIGYLRNSPTGLVGTRGSHYDYVLAGNGLFLEASSELLVARVQVSRSVFRGLKPMEPLVQLRHGKLPPYLWDLATSELLRDVSKERFVAVVWDGNGYSLRIPEQDVSAGGVHGIERQPHTVLDLHSHSGMPAYFSQTDDGDEVGFQVYGVAGRLNRIRPEYTFRVGIYGEWGRIRFADVFDGSPGTFLDAQDAAEAEALDEIDSVYGGR